MFISSVAYVARAHNGYVGCDTGLVLFLASFVTKKFNDFSIFITLTVNKRNERNRMIRF